MKAPRTRKPLGARLRTLKEGVRTEAGIAKQKLSDPEIIKALFKLLGVIAVMAILASIISMVYTDTDDLIAHIQSAKAFAPFIIILLIMLEVVIAPLPGFVIVVAAGYLFGPVWGAVYSYIGNVLGSILAFFLARTFGRPFAERFISKGLLDRYDQFFVKAKNYLVIIYALPIIPVDIVSFVCGFSSISKWRFIIAVMIGFIPNVLLLAFIGGKLQNLDLIATILYALVFLAVFLLLPWLFKIISKRMSEKK